MTDVAALVTAAAAAVASVAALITAARGLRATRSVHIIVNQQRTDAQRYQAVLVDALRSAGVSVPADQSLVPPD